MTQTAVVTDYPWKTLQEEPNEELQRIFLLYGQSGTGKTELSGQFNQVGKGLLLVSCDPGALGGALTALKYNPKHLKINDYRHLNEVFPKVKEGAGKEFSVICVDSISYLNRLVMQSILQTVGREIPRFEEWNLAAERTRNIVKQFTELNCHVIFTATQDTMKDEVTGKLQGGPNLPGKLAIELPQACDIVLRLFTTTGYNTQMKMEVTYKAQSVPDNTWFARDRTGTLAPEFLLGSNPDKGIKGFDSFKHLFKNELNK